MKFIVRLADGTSDVVDVDRVWSDEGVLVCAHEPEDTGDSWPIVHLYSVGVWVRCDFVEVAT